jgi:class 3 adenylate cyclase
MARELRAADEDRERVALALRDHFSAGRLTEDEFSGRVEAAYGARTLAELEDLTLDLPARGTALEPAKRTTPKKYVTPAGRALRASVRMHAIIFALVNVMLVAIWALSGGGYFWPIWSILGWGVGLGAHAAPVLAGAGTRPWRPELKPASSEDVADRVRKERPSLRAAAAPDGTVTILFSDIAGSTQLNNELGDVRWLELLRAHHAVIREQIASHDGFEVKVQGDGFMIAFPSARRAIDCARAIQAKMLDGIQVRIGLHTGEAVREEDDFYGRNVVLAARIAGAAEPGQILASSVVKHLVESAGDLDFGERRTVELKGLGATEVYAVAP